MPSVVTALLPGHSVVFVRVTGASVLATTMSNFALAYDFSGRDRRAAGPRRALTTVTLPWRQVTVTRSTMPPAHGGSTRWVLYGVIAILAISIHGGLLWYAKHNARIGTPPVRKHEVEVQLVSPPKPPLPKIEPPKPPPPKQAVKRQSLPQIQTAVPDAPSVEAAPVQAPVAVAPVAEPAAPPPPPETVSAPFGRAGYLNNPPPQYPNLAARNGWQGTVLLRVRVLSTGRVDAVEVEKSSGFKLLDEEAKATVRTWQFSPSKRGATPIDGWATVPIEFKLDS
jgi:periplasmic protein TonB